MTWHVHVPVWLPASPLGPDVPNDLTCALAWMATCQTSIGPDVHNDLTCAWAWMAACQASRPGTAACCPPAWTRQQRRTGTAATCIYKYMFNIVCCAQTHCTTDQFWLFLPKATSGFIIYYTEISNLSPLKSHFDVSKKSSGNNCSVCIVTDTTV